MVRQTVLPLKLEATDDTNTAQTGLVVFGEFLHSLNLAKEIDRMFGKPGSGAGYRASSYVLPLLLMLQGGGRSLEGLRMIARVVSVMGRDFGRGGRRPVCLRSGR